MHLKRALERIPGGLMIVPLLAGLLLNTFFPQVLALGSFTTALAQGSAPLIGAFLFCMGAGIRLGAAPLALRKGLAVTASKFLGGFLCGLAVGYWGGLDGFLGLSSLAIIAAMTNTNGGLYAALAGEFGDETDVGAIAILSLNDGPFLTLVALGAAGLATFPLGALVGVLLPVLLGAWIGNLDPECRDFLQRGGLVLIPLFAFSLGCGLHLQQLLSAGFPGLLLGAFTVFAGGALNIFTDRAVGGSGVCGAAASSTAGNAVATPAAVALLDPAMEPFVPAATAQVGAACLASVLLTPVLVTLVRHHHTRYVSPP